MAIITFNTTPERGTSTVVNLNKTELALVSSVAGDTYFSDSSNWNQVIVYFESDTNTSQKELVNFDATQISPSSYFKVSSTSLGNFQVQRLIIKDFDGGFLSVPRSELNTAEFDVVLSSDTLISQLIAPTYFASSISTDEIGQTFQYNRDFSISSIELALGKGANNNAVNTYVRVYEDPSRSNLLGQSLPVLLNTFPTTASNTERVVFNFSPSINNLTANTSYYFEFVPLNPFNFNYSTSDVYSGGNKYSNQVSEPNQDLPFVINGTSSV